MIPFLPTLALLGFLLAPSASAQFQRCSVCSDGCPFACQPSERLGRADQVGQRKPADPPPPAPDRNQIAYKWKSEQYQRLVNRNMPPNEAYVAWFMFWLRTGWRSGLYYAARSAMQTGDLATAEGYFAALTYSPPLGGFVDDKVEMSACAGATGVEGSDIQFFPWICEHAKTDLKNVRVRQAITDGFALQREKRFEEAEAWYRRAIELDADNPYGYYWLAGVLDMQDRHEESYEAARQACTHTPATEGCRPELDTPISHQYYASAARRNMFRAFELIAKADKPDADPDDMRVAVNQLVAALLYTTPAGDALTPGNESLLRYFLATAYHVQGRDGLADEQAGLAILRAGTFPDAAKRAQDLLDWMHGVSGGVHWPNPCASAAYDEATRDLSTMRCERRLAPPSPAGIAAPAGLTADPDAGWQDQRDGTFWRLYVGDDNMLHCQLKGPGERITEISCRTR